MNKLKGAKIMKKWRKYLPTVFYIATLAMLVLSSVATKKWW